MRSEWKEYKISDIANVIGGGTPKTSIKEYWNGDIPWLAPKDLTGYNNVYIANGNRYITELGLQKSSSKMMPKGTVLLTSRAPIGYVAIAKNEICTNQGFKSLVPKENLCISEFLYYWIKNNIDYLKQLGTGTTFAEISGSVLKSVNILLPPLPTQKKIAHILSTLDDKIELNRKMNETLEAMAQAMFKSWFVDFDPVHAKANAKSDAELEKAAAELGIAKEVLELFPSTFVESEMGMIPEGWEVKPLKDFGQVITGKTPSTKKKENYGNKYPFITIPDMHNQVFVVNTARYLSEEGHFVHKNKLIPKNSLIVSCIATVGLVSINSKASHTNQQINSVVCLPRYLYYLYCMLNGMRDKLIMYGSAGTATLNVNKNTFENINVIKPSDECLDTFFEMVSSLFDQILKNVQQIQILQQTRDMLLPKLLSGELDVSHLDSLI